MSATGKVNSVKAGYVTNKKHLRHLRWLITLAPGESNPEAIGDQIMGDQILGDIISPSLMCMRGNIHNIVDLVLLYMSSACCFKYVTSFLLSD